jgi:hypothetical protein
MGSSVVVIKDTCTVSSAARVIGMEETDILPGLFLSFYSFSQHPSFSENPGSKNENAPITNR